MTLPDRSYFVCATPRSGSTLLCASLAATGVAGNPEEYFDRLRHSGLPREPREYFPGDADPSLLDLLASTRTGHPTDADLAPVVPRALAEGTTPNGVFGAKVMWSYFDSFLGQVGATPERGGPAALTARFGRPAFIYVTRADKAAQAVSLWRALQTRAWRAEQDRGAVDPVYHAGAIAHLRDELREQDAAWPAWFRTNGLRPLVVEYDELAADHAATLRAVLAYLGLEAAAIPEPPTRRQGDERSDRWVARFNDEEEPS
jgi:trehalose 2-sulfotransferase